MVTTHYASPGTLMEQRFVDLKRERKDSCSCTIITPLHLRLLVGRFLPKVYHQRCRLLRLERVGRRARGDSRDSEVGMLVWE